MRAELLQGIARHQTFANGSNTYHKLSTRSRMVSATVLNFRSPTAWSGAIYDELTLVVA